MAVNLEASAEVAVALGDALHAGAEALHGKDELKVQDVPGSGAAKEGDAQSMMKPVMRERMVQRSMRLSSARNWTC